MADEKLPGDVLTQEQRESLVQQLELHLHHLHVHSDDVAHSLKKCGVWNLLREDYDRLVAKVERLRARNEALERVAKSVVEITHKMYQDREARGWCQDYYNALSALAEPGKGGATSERQRGVAGDRCEAGNNCGRPGCPECQA